MAETQYQGHGAKKLTAQVRFDGGVNFETLTGNKTLTNKSANFHKLNGGLSDRVVTLPTGTAEHAGTVFWFANVGTTNKITVKTAAAATVLDLVVGMSGAVGMDGEGNWGLLQTAIASPTDFGSGGLKTDSITESTATGGITVVGATTVSGGFTEKITGTINHATNNFRALWSKASAITTARTGGIVSAVMGELVGFATDTSGAKYAAFNGLAPTANGGSALYVWGYVAAGYTYLLDLTAVATGEALIQLNDNLAIALEVKEAANSYLKFVTANAAELIVTGVPFKLGSKLISIPDTIQDVAGAGGTITLPSAGIVKRLSATGSAGTGTILTAGVDGQIIHLFNITGNSITFAASGTSHVALGATCVIPALSAKSFVYDGVSSLWYSFGPT